MLELYIERCFGGFLGGSVVKNLPAAQELQETRVQSPGREDPLEEGMAAHSSILAWRIPMERGAWWATVSPWGCRVGHTEQEFVLCC